jgi:cytochrome c553
MRVVWSLPALVLLGQFVPASAGAADSPPQAAGDFFEKEVRPLLVERCGKCHGAEKPKGGLRLTSRANLLKGGESGPAAVAGKPEQSLLIQAIRYSEALQMPPKEKLGEREIAILTRWVELGLPWPEAKVVTGAAGAKFQITEEQRRFWAFQPVREVSPPAVKAENQVQSAIDRFILAGLEAKGQRLARTADRRTLLRRVTFDLTGLPPTPEEMDAFLRDASPDAFARVVDRLLASPAYGERWGRHWLDLVRYTDSFDTRGLGGEMDCADAWRYRDWVVDAFNRDLPYDRFVTDQIAGDLVPCPEGFNRAGTIATGFLALGNWGGGDADKEKLLTDIADDQVDVVSRTFLGLTVACARCHDHKFDPISTADYYGLAGIFFSTHILPNVGPKTNGPPMLRIPLDPPAQVARYEQYHRYLTGLEKKIKTAREAKSLSADARLALAKLTAERGLLQSTSPPAVAYANGAQEGGVPGSPHAGVHDIRVHVRGRYDRLGELVPRHFPEILAGNHQPPIVSGSGRLDLAHWLTRPDNPLTARVLVNRVWQYHFGEGIVRTPSNFGKLGERPTHPELLDWLARDFVRGGWSIKRLHRTILLSATYQQTSEPDPASLAADPDNRLFGRMNRRRLEAEAMRDGLLAVSGRLDLRQGGPAVREFASPRRTLYLMTVRSDRSGFGPLFDSADPTAPVSKRTLSTVAPQALFLLNNPFVLEAARGLARRVQTEATEQTSRIERAYALLYGRPPSEEEIRIGLDLLERSGGDERAWQEYCQVLLCANEFVYVD